MSLSGHDPSGGAGIQADIEAIKAQGCHASTVITCLTVQDTHNVYQVTPLPAAGILEQARCILADMPVQVFKIGLSGSLENIASIKQILEQHPDIPVVLDPVLAAGGGTTLASQQLTQAICTQLLPLTTIATPNIPEAQQLTGQEELADCAHILAGYGCLYSLITGTHATQTESQQPVINTLFKGSEIVSEYAWPRLPGSFHGSGCTLASNIAAHLAAGKTVVDAVAQAQQYTWNSLKNATTQGSDQKIPDR